MFRILLAASLVLGSAAARADEVVLYGAGSLRAVLTDITQDFSKKSGIKVHTDFGPSGLMREKIEQGDKVDILASADMASPLKLQRDGRASAVVMFTRNRLCAFALPEAKLAGSNFAERLLDPAVKLGTSTPKADPGGDYTWAMFQLIDKRNPGAFAKLDAKAQKIVGSSTAPVPAGQDPIADGFKSGQINVMMGYCSGAAQRKAATPNLEVIQVPEAYETGPEYGLALAHADNAAAVALMLAILSPEGQATFGRYGFAPVGLPSQP
ncbi:extracellular solute-binding protein [Labrys neptuniae]|uniref:extracellular solute-binding protein n=1 Tax=Labrys neptuniae TaxID=376174 RepID=UPI00288DAD24|nr:extracellular solute-binding protein [Labrys neptuniae]MDT3378053.1 extracellular solute-binding protein [Labrys neptuniae]